MGTIKLQYNITVNNTVNTIQSLYVYIQDN